MGLFHMLNNSKRKCLNCGEIYSKQPKKCLNCGGTNFTKNKVAIETSSN